MFFTKPEWSAPYRFAGDAFSRWQLIGVASAEVTFMVRTGNPEADPADGFFWLVAGPESLLQMLDQSEMRTPEVFALGSSQLVHVRQIWSYSGRSRSKARFFTYVDQSGRTHPCAVNQPDPEDATEHSLVWDRTVGVPSPDQPETLSVRGFV